MVRPAKYARSSERREAGKAPRYNIENWPRIETGQRLRQMIQDKARRSERSSQTLRRLSEK